MSTLYFWNNWPRHHRRIFQVFLFLLASAFIFYLTGYFWSAKLLIQWETISQIKAVSLVLEKFILGSFQVEIPADFYAITQIFSGSDLQLVSWPAHLLLAAMALCLVVALALAVDLSRFWFLVSQIVFIFILVALKLEQLLLFERTDKLGLIIAFVLFLPLGYYFHAINKSYPLLSRIATFAVVTTIFGVLVYFFSGVSKPFLYLVNYGITVPVAATLLFILSTSHEVIYGFLVLITRSNTPKSSNSFSHFLALSIIYLVNMLLLYLKNSRRIDWDFYYLDAFWVLVATTLIGLWGLRQRKELYKNIMSFEPHAALGYVAMAVISFSTIGYFFATANDPVIEAFEDAIVFSQLCIGFMFLIYILFNFRTVLIENLKVYKVVYKPQKMPFFTMRLGGLIGVLGLFLLSNQYPLNQAITGYYNGIGDLHRVDGKSFLAQEYYKLAAIYASTNHRSNYAIASMAEKEKKYGEALNYYKQSTLKQPTPFAYVNTANLYQRQASFFQALFTLKKGLKEFPGNGQIINNLAMLYAQTDILDSAFYFLQLNENNEQVAGVTKTNQLALIMRTPLDLSVDSLYQTIDRARPEEQTNLLLYASRSQYSPAQNLTPPPDSLLNPLVFSWWYNHTLNLRQRDTSHLNFLNQISKIPDNSYYNFDLQFAQAVAQYYSGNVVSSFSMMSNLAYLNTSKSGYYNFLLGLWCLEQQAPRLAQDYLDLALQAKYVKAVPYKMLALMATGQLQQAAQYTNALQALDEPVDPQIPEALRFLLEDSPAAGSRDIERFWQLQFDPSLDAKAIQSAILDMNDMEVQQASINWALNAVQSKDDIMSYRKLGPEISDQNRTARMLWEVQQGTVSGQYSPSQVQEKELEESNSGLRLWQMYALALKAEATAAVDTAESYYLKLARNPFFTPGVLAAAAFFNGTGNPDTAYSILLESVTINQYEIALIREYAHQCIRMNLDNYARLALERLSPLVDSAQWERYRIELETLARQVETASEDWDQQ